MPPCEWPTMSTFVACVVDKHAADERGQGLRRRRDVAQAVEPAAGDGRGAVVEAVDAVPLVGQGRGQGLPGHVLVGARASHQHHREGVRAGGRAGHIHARRKSPRVGELGGEAGEDGALGQVGRGRGASAGRSDPGQGPGHHEREDSAHGCEQGTGTPEWRPHDPRTRRPGQPCGPAPLGADGKPSGCRQTSPDLSTQRWLARHSSNYPAVTESKRHFNQPLGRMSPAHAIPRAGPPAA